ncbi:hypothetical protein N0V95_008282 [Ascochyta clinopodiicola]|nr:hypothetical protein N0V95_008282 [Ascochyta clinopodiicola]
MPSLFISCMLLLAVSHALAQSTQDATTVSAEYTNDDTFQKAVLNTTNLYRRQHDAVELGWNETLAEAAGKWSEKCGFEHSGGPSGENLAAGYPNATAAIEAWGDERKEYDFKKGDFSKNRSATGHFTQLVWRNTTTVGCARTECNAKEKGGKGDAPGWYIVCEYYPTGNVLGQFTANVMKQLPADQVPSASGAPTATGGPTANATPQGAASGMRGSLAALWVGIVFALVVAL